MAPQDAAHADTYILAAQQCYRVDQDWDSILLEKGVIFAKTTFMLKPLLQQKTRVSMRLLMVEISEERSTCTLSTEFLGSRISEHEWVAKKGSDICKNVSPSKLFVRYGCVSKTSVNHKPSHVFPGRVGSRQQGNGCSRVTTLLPSATGSRCANRLSA